MDQGASGPWMALGLPNSVRRASATAVTGFHSANVRRTLGSDSTGTNVLAMNVIGKIAVKATPCTASGDGRRLPISTPTQMIANENPIIRAYAPTASSTEALARASFAANPSRKPAPGLALLASLALPGAGQLLNGDRRAFFYLGVEAGAWFARASYLDAARTKYLEALAAAEKAGLDRETIQLKLDNLPAAAGATHGS